MRLPRLDVRAGDPVEVMSTERYAVPRRGRVVSVTERHCLVDLGLYKESFTYEQVSLVRPDGTLEPVRPRVSIKALDRVLALSLRGKPVHEGHMVDALTPIDDEQPTVQLRARKMERRRPALVEKKLDEFVRRYNSGEFAKDIRRAMKLPGEQYAVLLDYAAEHGLVVRRRTKIRKRALASV